MISQELLFKHGRIKKIPKKWKLLSVGQACSIRNDLRKPISVEERKLIKGEYPYYGPTGILGYINEFLVDGSFALIGEDGDHFLKPREKSQTQFIAGQFNVNNHAHIIETTNDCNAEWFSIYFKHRNITVFLTRQGANRYKLNKSALENLPILLPPLPEQKAIAEVLSTWDAAIEKTERLIQAKEKRFQWLLRELISAPRNTQNDAKWKKVKLGEIASIAKKEKLKTLEGEALLTVKLHCLGIDKNDRIQPTLTARGRPYFKRDAGEFLIGRQNFHNGGFGIVPQNLHGRIASNAITSLEIMDEKLNVQFLYYTFSDSNYYKRIGHIMDGTGQKELSDKQIMKLEILLPPLDEQNVIAETLNEAHQEIDLLKKLADKYKEQKRGLMQKLLTGTWRVAIKEIS